MGLRERYTRKRLGKVYRANAAECDAFLTAQAMPTRIEAKGFNLPATQPYLTPKRLASMRDRWLAAADYAEAGRWDEATAIAASVQEEMRAIEAQDPSLRSTEG